MLPIPCPLCERSSPNMGACRCGLAIWIGGLGWMISFDFIARLSVSLRTLHPEAYQALMASLSVEIPQDLPRLLKAAKLAVQ